MKKNKKILSKIFIWLLVCVLFGFMSIYGMDLFEKLSYSFLVERELKPRTQKQIEVIEEYESLYSEYAEDLDIYLATGEPNVLTEDDKFIAKYYIYKMKEPYRTIFLENIDEFEIAQMIDAETPEGTAYFLPTSNKVYIESISGQLRNMQWENVQDINREDEDREASSQGNELRETFPYVLVHESAHAIDYHYGENDFMTTNYTVYSEAMGKDVTLQETIIYDIHTYIKNKICLYTSDEKEVSNILQAFYSNVIAEQLTENEKRIREVVISECKNGITYGFIVEEMYFAVAGSEFVKGIIIGYHDFDYYWDENGEPTGTMAQELWAEYFAQTAFHYNFIEEEVREYLPESYKLLQAMTESIVSEINTAESENETNLESLVSDVVAEIENTIPVKELNQTMYATGSVNTRIGDSTDYEKIGSLTLNQEVLVTGQSERTGWYRIDVNGQEMYVSNNYLSTEKTVVALPPSNNGGGSGTYSSNEESENWETDTPYDEVQGSMDHVFGNMEGTFGQGDKPNTNIVAPIY